MLLPAASNVLEATSIHSQQCDSDAAVVSTFLKGSVVGVVLPLFLAFVLRVARSSDFPKTTNVFKLHLPTLLRRLGRILSRFSPSECTQTVQVNDAEGKTEEVSVHETSHPYERGSKRVRVHIPGCSSLTLAFDPRCCTRTKDTLVVTATSEADNTGGKPTTMEFSGRFVPEEGERSDRTVPGDTLTLDFKCEDDTTDDLASDAPAAGLSGSENNSPPEDASKDGSGDRAVVTVEDEGDTSKTTDVVNAPAASESVSGGSSSSKASAGASGHDTESNVVVEPNEEEDARTAETNSVPARTEVPGW